MPYALFKDGTQVSKAHSTRLAAQTEAHEAGAVVNVKGMTCLASGYEIRALGASEPCPLKPNAPAPDQGADQGFGNSGV